MSWLSEIEETSSDYPIDSWVKRMALVLREQANALNEVNWHSEYPPLEDPPCVCIYCKAIRKLSDDAKELLDDMA